MDLLPPRFWSKSFSLPAPASDAAAGLQRDDELRLVVGRRIRKALASGALADGFLAYEGKKLAEPVRRPLSMPLVRSHRKAFVDGEN